MHRGAELYPDGLLRKHVAQRNANNRFFSFKGEALNLDFSVNFSYINNFAQLREMATCC